jgi:hypothetical protein
MPFQVTALPTDAETGVRTAPKTPEQLQALFKHALVAGMQCALECRRSWAVVNGAVHAWNTFLPVLRAGRCVLSSTLTRVTSLLCLEGHRVTFCRHVEVQSALTEVLQELLKLDTSEQNGSLLHVLAVAVLQAFEHAYLLKVLQHVSASPPPVTTAGTDSGSVTSTVCQPGMLLEKGVWPMSLGPVHVCGSECTDIPISCAYTHKLLVCVTCFVKRCPAHTPTAKSAHMGWPGVQEMACSAIAHAQFDVVQIQSTEATVTCQWHGLSMRRCQSYNGAPLYLGQISRMPFLLERLP